MAILLEDEASDLINFKRDELRDSYMEKAINIGTNAINLVRDYFDYRVTDFVNGKPVDWSLGDLDRALTEMKRAK